MSFEPRVRFNWGYWDGTAPKSISLEVSGAPNHDEFAAAHFDHVFGAGYAAGLADMRAGTVGETSDAAWERYKGRAS